MPSEFVLATLSTLASNPFTAFRDVWVCHRVQTGSSVYFLSSTSLSDVPTFVYRGFRASTATIFRMFQPPGSLNTEHVNSILCESYWLVSVLLTSRGRLAPAPPPRCATPSIRSGLFCSDADKKRILELYSGGRTSFERFVEQERR